MIAVIGCGNPNRRDDGVGPDVIARLRARCAAAPPPDVAFLDAGTDGMSVMFAAKGCRSLILIDACRSGAAPGSIFQVPGASLAQAHDRSFSLHDFRWDHALFAGRKIFGAEFPSDVAVILVEAENTGFGIGLSLPVLTAAGRAVELVAAMLEARQVCIPARS
jgi:hydrogenase maturation protease